MLITAERYHDISCGHRVAGHESKCAHLHGHNYRITFTIEAQHLDDLGRVLDFSVIKEKLCQWLEANWDHKFLAWIEDPVMRELDAAMSHLVKLPGYRDEDALKASSSLVWLPFSPTAENLAAHLLQRIGPHCLSGTGAQLIMVRVEETRKCSANATL